ncbi:eukaryotic translation initiation factor 3 [Favolaschia claudopus]|uniref:Eukaryotic translation initiation factor 3 n=1 Tax=Favolaschia claudopus TaxID=2862362 RepID=A0AAV9Z1B0_9AGAR
MSAPPLAAPANARPRRTALPSARISDTNNSEPLTADQKRGLDAKRILTLIKKIEALAPHLPDSVKEATPDDNDLHRILTEVAGIEDSPWGSLNRKLDALFGSDKRENGRLVHIRRGSRGMSFLATYLAAVDWKSPEYPVDLAEIKVQRIVDEMEFLCGENAIQPSKKRSGVATSKTVNIDPSTFLDPPKPAAGPKTNSNAAAARSSGKKDAANSDDEDPDYAPPKRGDPVLSEEEDDDFTMEDAVKPASPVKPAAASTTKTSKASAAAPPLPEVIEIDDDEAPEKKRGKRGPKSDTRLHYRAPAMITNASGKRWEFQCLHCPTINSGTFDDDPVKPKIGNLATHRRAHGDEPIPNTTKPGETRGVSVASAKIMEAFLLEGKLDPAVRRTQGGFYKVFAAWLLEDDLPFTTGQTDGIHRLFQYMQVKWELPSDTTVRNTLARIFCEMHEHVMKDLKIVKSKIAASTDTWTTRSMQYTFAGTILNWIDEEWNLIERVVDFHAIEDKEHEGQYAAYGLAECLSKLRALEKISSLISYDLFASLSSLYTISLTLDNVASNKILVEALARLLREKFNIPFNPLNSQIRCIAHVINLVVQKFLSALDEAADPENDDYFESTKDQPIHYDADCDPVQLSMEKEADEDEEDEDDEVIEAGRIDKADAILVDELADEYANLSPLKKLRLITTKICSSPQRRRSFRRIADAKFKNQMHAPHRKLAALLPVRDVKHRWNYTEAMITRARLLRSALDQWVLDHAEFN